MKRSRRGMESKNTQKALAHPSPKALAWAAGFLEGEGSFHPGNESCTIVSAFQVNEEPVRRLLGIFGGSLKQYTFGLKTPGWLWAVSGSRARGTAMTLYTLMSAKRKGQIRRALARC